MMSKISSTILQSVIKTIKEFKMIAPGEHVLVGVSGGADSVALLHVLHALKRKLELILKSITR